MPPHPLEMMSMWGVSEPSTRQWNVDCLMPTGIIVPLNVDREATLADIKEELWKEAQKYPLYASLKGKASYVFVCINKLAEKVELENENNRLCDVGLFQPMLKVVQRQGGRAEKISNAQISLLIGKGVHEFDAIQSTEVSDFRVRKRQMCEQIALERDSKPWDQRVMCMYPPDVTSDKEVPKHLASKLIQDELPVKVSIDTGKSNTNYVTCRIHCTALPESLIKRVLQKMGPMKKGLLKTPRDANAKYILKVVGRNEYLLGEYQIIQFNYIRKSVLTDTVPELALVTSASIRVNDPPVPARRKQSDGVISAVPSNRCPKPTIPARRRASDSSAAISAPLGNLRRGVAASGPGARMSSQQRKCLWDLSPDDKYSIRLTSVANVSLLEMAKVRVRACICHGWEAMSSVVNCSEKMISDGCAEWNEDMTFTLALPDVPRMSRLCFLLYMMVDRRTKTTKVHTGGRRYGRGRQEIRPVAWVNIPVFDYRGQLRSGSQVLYMWSLADEDFLLDTALNPIGTVECNPGKDEAVELKFEFNVESGVYYPENEKVLEVAAKNTHVKMLPRGEGENEYTRNTAAVDSLLVGTDDPRIVQLLSQMVDKDPLHEMAQQEREKIWGLRLECHHSFPHSLPKVLSCVQWDNHISVALMQALLQIWQPLKPSQAIELLDFMYPDKAVRNFAVTCLQSVSDSELCQYLLQLVQVLKYEPYLECDLVNFLLERALNNQHVGHYLFWLLRSEMHVPSVAVRFGLILEAFCHGTRDQHEMLSKQVDALNKLRLLSESIKMMSDTEKMSRDKVKEEMHKLLSTSAFQDPLSDLRCILDPREILKEPRIGQCTFMDSKMKPLWMVWEPQDPLCAPTLMLYKKGDDLRQDMLTLQILRIMDNIWQAEGLDLRLNAYGCLSTGDKEGMIGIVTEGSTIARIQRQYADGARAAFNKHCLYEYLKYHNPQPESLKRALEEFTLSCAGYCVATYVLGIGDRHSDNILLRKNGQLLHIDFGHVLGHFKSKLGFKRERVPFVLTADFVYVIKRGPTGSSEQFNRFKKLCEQAYLSLRRHSNFIINLFLMMMNTGIPEVSSLDDVEFLRETLRPHMLEEEALDHWRGKCNEALRNSFWPAVNNFFHHMARDNK